MRTNQRSQGHAGQHISESPGKARSHQVNESQRHKPDAQHIKASFPIAAVQNWLEGSRKMSRAPNSLRPAGNACDGILVEKIKAPPTCGTKQDTDGGNRWSQGGDAKASEQIDEGSPPDMAFDGISAVNPEEGSPLLADSEVGGRIPPVAVVNIKEEDITAGACHLESKAD